MVTEKHRIPRDREQAANVHLQLHHLSNAKSLAAIAECKTVAVSVDPEPGSASPATTEARQSETAATDIAADTAATTLLI